MKERNHKWRYWFVFGLSGVSICCAVLVWQAVRRQDETEVVFLSIGQGDAILIHSGTTEVLIDAGADGKLLLSRLGRHIPFWDRTIETVIATHSDRDHIGGFPSVFHSYRVLSALTNGYEDGTESEKLFFDAIRSEGISRQPIRAGTEIVLPGGGGVFTAEHPSPHGPPLSDKESNEGSIVLRFVYGESSILFTGDLPREESFLTDEQPVDILKVAHHGSKYSSSDAFLDLTRPREAVISVGKNRYGHPAPEVTDRLIRRGIDVHRTDMEGNIVYVCRERKCVKRD
jgi:competence protein ComEC